MEFMELVHALGCNIFRHFVDHAYGNLWKQGSLANEKWGIFYIYHEPWNRFTKLLRRAYIKLSHNQVN